MYFCLWDPPNFLNSVSSKTIQDPYFYYHQHPVSSLLSCRSKFCRRDHYKIQNILSPLIRGDSRYFLFLTKFFFRIFWHTEVRLHIVCGPLMSLRSLCLVYPIIPKSDSDFQLEAVCGIWLLEICLTFVNKLTIWCQEKLPKECIIFPINVANPFLIHLFFFIFTRIHIDKGLSWGKIFVVIWRLARWLEWLSGRTIFPTFCLESQNRNMKGTPWEKRIFVATFQFGFLKVFTIIFSLLPQPLRDWSSLLIHEYTNHASRHGGQRKKNT